MSIDEGALVPFLLPWATTELGSIAAWCGSSTTAVVTCLHAATRTCRAARAVQGDVWSVWQVLHGTAQRLAHFCATRCPI